MSDKRKLCPFCGKAPSDYSTLPGVTFVGCKNPECYLYMKEYASAELWNTRPIEDDLRKQLAEKDAEIERLKDVCCL